jgi:hypothetical protein
VGERVEVVAAVVIELDLGEAVRLAADQEGAAAQQPPGDLVEPGLVSRVVAHLARLGQQLPPP